MNSQQNQHLRDHKEESALKKSAPMLSTPVTAGSRIIFVGASTGGTEAVSCFLQKFPQNCPPILIVQHMPELFTGSFAARLNGICKPQVIESKGNETIQTGLVYIAPGHSHMTIEKSKSGTGYITVLAQTPPVNRHRPSVDVLFESAAKVVGRSAIGVILTGMGKMVLADCFKCARQVPELSDRTKQAVLSMACRGRRLRSALSNRWQA